MQFFCSPEILKKLEKYKSISRLPDKNELKGAIAGLLRVQDIYRLRTKDLANGLIEGMQYE